MKKTISPKALILARAKRLNVSEAKARLSEALRDLAETPKIIHNRGRDVGVLLGLEDFERLLAAHAPDEPSGMREFIDAVDALKRELGGGATLPRERIELVPKSPFGRSKK